MRAASGQTVIETSCCRVEGTKVSVYPSRQKAVASSNVTFKCVVATDPEETSSVQVYWRRGGRWLVMTDQCTHRCLVTSFDGRFSSLLMTEVSVADSGEYICQAISRVDVAATAASLIVLGLSLFSSTDLLLHLFSN